MVNETSQQLGRLATNANSRRGRGKLAYALAVTRQRWRADTWKANLKRHQHQTDDDKSASCD
jgi:3-methyladenine DNA glycosylase Mpg